MQRDDRFELRRSVREASVAADCARPSGLAFISGICAGGLASLNHASSNDAVLSEINQDPAAVGRIRLHADIELLNMFLLKKSQYPSLQFARSLARDNLNNVDPGAGSFEDDLPQRQLDVAVISEERVQVQGEQRDRLRSRPSIGSIMEYLRHGRPAPSSHGQSAQRCRPGSSAQILICPLLVPLIAAGPYIQLGWGDPPAGVICRTGAI